MQLGDKTYTAVILLGAGASRGAIKHVLHNRKRLKSPLNGDFFKVADTYARGEGRGSPARRRLDRLLRAFKRDLPLRRLPTMEEAFSLLYIAKDFPEIYHKGPGRRMAAGARQEIDDFLNLLFPILTALDRGNEQSSGYDRLVRRLSSDDTLITLNYDTMLDSALHRRGWDPRLGYAIGGAPSKFKWKPITPRDVEKPLQAKLIKLHGSTNWFVRGSTANLKKVFSSKPVQITKPRENGIAKHIRQIAPPIYAKIFEHPHWRQLWAEAFDALCAADVFVVIGCSLIDTDFHLRALLTQVVRTRKQNENKFRYLILVDRTKVRRKWSGVLKGGFREAKPYTNFEKFLEE